MHFLALATYVLAGFASQVSASSGVNFLRSGLVAESDVKEMLSSELGASGDRTREIVQSLETMYTALPKNDKGRLDHQTVRYALHRFFVHRYGWFIRGLEPNNDTWHGALDPDAHNSSALKEWVPSYLQDILEQRLGTGGSDLQQLAALAATLADLIQREVLGRLEATYRMHGFPKDKLLDEHEALDLISTYYVGFLVASDFAVNSVRELEHKKRHFFSNYVGWPQAEDWLRDLCKAHLKTQQNRLDGGSGFAFEDIEHLVSKIGQDYYKFNDKECTDLKHTLHGMQGKRPGRVRLSTFYHMGMYTHWHFTENADYLRALGALDDSDPKQPFVIISNYAMARPNCLDSSNLYTICCRNECEDLMHHLEREIGGATATPRRLEELVAALPSPTVAAPRNLSKALLSHLADVAKQHGGEVPMHGRLFAQWMHHAYPLECPYPHELGAVNPQTPDEWMKETGHKSGSATAEEMSELVALDGCAEDSLGNSDCADESPDLPWSDSEELLTWHPRDVVGRISKVSALSRHSILMLASLVSYLENLLDGWLLVCAVACGALVMAINQGFRHKGSFQKVQPQKCQV